MAIGFSLAQYKTVCSESRNPYTDKVAEPLKIIQIMQF
mgnify:CR=1 FL=1